MAVMATSEMKTFTLFFIPLPPGFVCWSGPWGYAAMYWPCLGTYFTLNGGKGPVNGQFLSIFIFESAYNQTGESATNQDRYNEFKYCICSKMKLLSFTKAPGQEAYNEKV